MTYLRSVWLELYRPDRNELKSIFDIQSNLEQGWFSYAILHLLKNDYIKIEVIQNRDLISKGNRCIPEFYSYNEYIKDLKREKDKH